MSKQLSKNIFIYGFTTGLKSLVPFILLPILTTYLTKEDYGILSLLELTILFVTPFIMLNIPQAVKVEYFHLKKDELKVYISNALAISSISFLIFLSIALIFMQPLSSLFELSSGLIILIPVFALLRVVSGVMLIIFQAAQKPGNFSLYTVFQVIIDFLFSYLFVVIFKYGYTGRLSGIYLSFFVSTVMGIIILLKMDLIGKIRTFKYSKDILKFGIPLIPHTVGGTVMAMSNRYFISYFVNVEEVGVYTVAYQLAGLMLLMGVTVNQAWSPILFNLLKNRSKDNTLNISKYTVRLMVGFILFGLFIYFFSDILFSVFVDEKFYEAKKYFPYLLIGFVFQSLYFLVTNFLLFEKRTIVIAKVTIFSALLNLVMNYFLIINYGAIGVAYSTAITWFIFFVLISFIVLRTSKRKERTDADIH